jgi:hypothetical protein
MAYIPHIEISIVCEATFAAAGFRDQVTLILSQDGSAKEGRFLG